MAVDSEEIKKQTAEFEAKGGKIEKVGSTEIKEVLPPDVQRRLDKMNGGPISAEEKKKMAEKSRSRGGRAARDSKRQSKS